MSPGVGRGQQGHERTVATREAWDATRAGLLAREKEHTRRGDVLARERRELPWLPIERENVLATETGSARSPAARSSSSSASWSRPGGRRGASAAR